MYIDNTCKTGSFNYNNSYYMANGVGPYDNNWYAGVQSGYTLVEMEVRALFCFWGLLLTLTSPQVYYYSI